MAVTSVGYDGTVTESQWASVTGFLGSRPSVGGADDLAVTIDSGVTRGVQVAAGTVYADGVMDVVDAAFGLSATAVSSGTRWDTVAVRRDWSGTGGTTSVVVIAGGTDETATVTYSTPGIQCDYPIALILVSSSSTVIQEVVDLRGVCAGGVVAYDSASGLPDAGEMPDGALALVRSSYTGWMPYVVSDGEWLDWGNPTWKTLPLASNRSTYTVTPMYKRTFGLVSIRGTLQRTEGTFLTGVQYPVATLPAGYRPAVATTVPIASSYGGNPSYRMIIGTDGVLTVLGGEDVSWVSVATVFAL